MSDLVWSDPDENVKDWGLGARGAGFLYGELPVDEFMHRNKLDYMCRAHQIAMAGYQLLFSNQNCVTVWSAPNYCYRCGNLASVLKIDDFENREFVVFDAVPKHLRGGEKDTSTPNWFM
eukprot:TRINITY_DN1566_c0_g1_i1.p2 TRINITY_DN1566_c0_g1~~TRINITY_DN1566_c0_g1_i1.p2  ORF type:complete len:119 (-),score=28.31 TRINITY_DN1566_c0_g1_i1:281-637(-)